MTNNIEIDSLKIRIPFRDIEIVNLNLNSHYLTINKDTAEEIDEFKNTALGFKNKGISTRFLIGTQPIDSKGNTEDYLYILLNSKLLKQDYFQGICHHNLKTVYQELMNYNVAKFSYDSFLNAECTDIDFKLDQTIKSDAYKELIDYLKKNTKESNQQNKGYSSFTAKANKGIQWSDRTTTAFSTNPFIKIYHKQLELEHHSKEFKNNYLQNQSFTDKVRTEFTIKNKKHLTALGIENNTLKFLVSLKQEQKTEILKTTMSSHIYFEPKHTPRNKEQMTPTEAILFSLITEQMSSNITYFKIRDKALSLIEVKQARSRKKQDLDSIYKRFIQGSKKDETTQEVSSFLQSLGID